MLSSQYFIIIFDVMTKMNSMMEIIQTMAFIIGKKKG